MSCIYNSWEGICTLWDEDHPVELLGTDNKGFCVCDEDPDPTLTCESFEPIEGWDEYNELFGENDD